MKFEDIKSVMDQLGIVLGLEALPLKIFREGLKRDKEQYPYATYNVLAVNQEPETSASVTYAPVDAVSFDQIIKKKQKTTITLNFLHDKSLPAIMELAETAMDWFDSVDGMKLCETFGITPQIVTGDIQNKSAIINDTFYEYKVGFDVLFQAKKTIIRSTPIMAPDGIITNLEVI